MITGLFAFLLLLLALLAIPVTLMFQVSWQQALQSDIKLIWLFGLVRIQLPSSQAKTTPKKDSTKPAKTGHVKRSPRKKRNVFAAVRQKAFRQRIFRYIRDFWRAIQKNKLNLRVRVGLGDPADTGQLWAFVGPIAGLLTTIQHTTISIEPEFFDATFELDSNGNIRIIPLQLLYITAALLLSPPIWQGIKQMRVVKN